MLDREVQALDGPGVHKGALTEGPRVPRPVEDPSALLWDGYGRMSPPPELVSAVGHADTAAIFDSILGVRVQPNRISVRLQEDDRALIGQYIGPRLPEDCTTLPEGARIEWWIV
jgi:hypothetical protein